MKVSLKNIIMKNFNKICGVVEERKENNTLAEKIKHVKSRFLDHSTGMVVQYYV